MEKQQRQAGERKGPALIRWLDEVGQDARFAVRGLRRSPGFAALAILVLALAIAANTAIFALVDVLMLRPLGTTGSVRMREKSAAPAASRTTSSANAAVRLPRSTTRPATVGPRNWRVAMKPIVPKITPFWSCARARIWGSRLWRAGFVKAARQHRTAQLPEAASA